MAKIRNDFLLGGVNKDADERLVPNGSVTDIQNAITSVSEGDDRGTLENVLGNTLEASVNSAVEVQMTNPQVVGSVSNDKDYIIYYFVKGDVYSAILEFNTQTLELTQVLQDGNGILNFNQRIPNINIIEKSSESNDLEESSDLLAFSGDDNPPRIINVERSKAYATSGFLEDDINVIKPAPRYAPDITPLSLPEINDSFEDKFITFAYRYKYKDGYYSAISSNSEYAFTPSSFNINFDTFENEGMSNIYNAYDVNFDSGNEVVTDVQLLFKESNSVNWYIIETLNKSDEGFGNNEEQTFRFKHNKNYRVLPESQYYRNFDNVPLSSKAQEYADGRLMYGNYVEQRNLLDENGDKVTLDYTVDYDSFDFSSEEININQVEDDGGATKILELDFSNVTADFFEGKTRLDINFNLINIQETDSFIKTFTVFFDPPNFASIPSASFNAFWIQQAIQDALTSFRNFFVDSGFSEPINTESSTVSTDAFQATISSSNNQVLRIQLPTIVFSLSNGGSLTYSFTDNGTTAQLINNSSSSSMKSIRDYEVAMIFLDKEGRKTTALTSNENTVSIPISASDKRNSLKVNIPESQKVPEWADRYKFAVKKVGLWENFYANRFYSDGAFRWVKLEGGDINKVSVGDDIIVKKDSDSIQDTLGEVKILDIVKQDRDFIEGNQIEGTTSDLIEEPGDYIKLRPSNFSLDYAEDEIKQLGYKKSSVSSGRPFMMFTPPDDLTVNTFAQSNNPDEDLRIGSGSILDIKLLRSFVVDTYDSTASKTYVANANYDNIYDFMTSVDNYTPVGAPDPSETHTDGTYPTGFFEILDEDENEDLIMPYWIVRGEIEENPFVGSFNLSDYLLDEKGDAVVDADLNNFGVTAIRLDPNKPYVMAVRGARSESGSRAARLELEGIFRSVDGYYVFETKEKPVTDNIFYETPETYDIVSGEYEQNEHILSRYFNCYTQGNGAESYRYKDRFNANFLNVDYTPTTVTEDKYVKLNRFADITYSARFNDNSGVNGLNEFNLSTANFKDDIDKRYGGIYKLHNRNTRLIIAQEDKISYVGIGKSQLFNADGTSNVSRIETVLGNQDTYAGEYGIATDTESFVAHSTAIYFTDRKRGVVCRLTNNGIFEISGVGMTSYFRNLFREQNVGQIIGAYDDFYNTYVLNLNLGLGNYETWFWKEAINQKGGGWISNQRFFPEDMININGNLYSFKNGNVYRHNARDVGVYNTFYGVEEPSKFTIAMNAEPNNRKNFKTIELDGSDKWDMKLNTNLSSTASSNIVQGHVDVEDYEKEEGIYRAFIRGNQDVTSINTESLHVQGIGNNTIVTDFGISFDNPINEEVAIGDYIANSSLEVVGQITSINQDLGGQTTVITVNNTPDPNGITNLNSGDFTMSFKPQTIETSGLVGNHLNVEGELNKNTKAELFSVSSEVFVSYPKT